MSAVDQPVYPDIAAPDATRNAAGIRVVPDSTLDLRRVPGLDLDELHEVLAHWTTQTGGHEPERIVMDHYQYRTIVEQAVPLLKSGKLAQDQFGPAEIVTPVSNENVTMIYGIPVYQRERLFATDRERQVAWELDRRKRQLAGMKETVEEDVHRYTPDGHSFRVERRESTRKLCQECDGSGELPSGWPCICALLP